MSFSIPAICPDSFQAGFTFTENISRNSRLHKEGYPVPNVVKTGTTIVGIRFKDGVILGADTRATDVPIISDKSCDKIHYLQPNIYCCGAGTAADAHQTSQMIAAELTLHQFDLNRPVQVETANQILKQYLFRFKGTIGAAFIIGGVDVTGPQLYSVFPHGSSDHLPYTSMGSGSLSAIAIIEHRWKSDLKEEEAIEIVRDAVAAGIYNDLGSGSNVDICIIRKNSVDMRRNFDVVAKRPVSHFRYRHLKGTTAVLSSNTTEIVHSDEEEESSLVLGQLNK